MTPDREGPTVRNIRFCKAGWQRDHSRKHRAFFDLLEFRHRRALCNACASIVSAVFAVYLCYSAVFVHDEIQLTYRITKCVSSFGWDDAVVSLTGNASSSFFITCEPNNHVSALCSKLYCIPETRKLGDYPVLSSPASTLAPRIAISCDPNGWN